MHLRTFVGLSLFAIAVAGCGGSGSSGPAPAPSSSQTARASATPNATPTASSPGTPSPSAQSKAALHGLVSMGSESFVSMPSATPDNGMEEINAHPGVYTGAVINVTWAQLEPSEGAFDTSSIQSGLAAIASYNAAHPGTPVVGKLRIFVGTHVPAWLFSVAGGPITLTDANGNSGQFAAWWSAGYQSAWRALQAHLAGIYDETAGIGEVAISSCASLTAEPFIEPLDTKSVTALHGAGYTDAQMEACLQSAPADYAAWTVTPLDYTFNEFHETDGSSVIGDPAFTTSEMQAFRSSIGARAVIANHGLQDPLDPDAQAIYPEFTALGPPIEFQTYGPDVDWQTAFNLGLSYGMSEIEIWQTIAAGGQANLSQSQLQGFASQL